jgi:phosphoserine phosphatase RsbU/P
VNLAAAALLVVDDNEDNRYTLTRRLAREGYANVTTANDGRQALDLLRAQRFDLVLLDIMMPDLNGYQVLEQLKVDSRLRHVPVIMISAVEELESVVRCIELGAEDYLPKPFNSTLLRARVGACLEKKALRDEVRTSLDRLERELGAARELQLGMLPSSFPQWSATHPIEVHALIDPAREVGGDLYDFFYPGDGMFCFLVGDVSGKGAPAAMFMARTRSLVRMAATLWNTLGTCAGTPAQIMSAVNRELCLDNRDRMFVTLFLGMLDTRTGGLTYSNAGHPLPHVLRASGATERIDGKPEVPLGVLVDFEYEGRSSALQPGDAVFVCTDGVIEAMSETGERYTDVRLNADLRAACALSPEAMVRAVKAHVDAFTGAAPKADDVAMLALRWLPAQPQSSASCDRVTKDVSMENSAD